MELKLGVKGDSGSGTLKFVKKDLSSPSVLVRYFIAS